MKMIDLGSRTGPLRIIETPVDIDCAQQVRYRHRSFRSLIQSVVPCCGFQQTTNSPSTSDSTHRSTVTGTFFGYRKNRVTFCIQDSSKTLPLLLLEFTIPTSYLAKEMQHGLLRIALECDRIKTTLVDDTLLGIRVWSMYCNGRKVGYAVRREVTGSDVKVLKEMKSVSVGTGVLPVEEGDGELMYLRAGFQRVVGSPDSESFHMINPVESCGQELSVFFIRT